MSAYKRSWPGSSSYVRANSAALAWVSGKAAITVAFWIKDFPSSSGTDVIFQIHRNSTATSSNWFKAEIDGSGNLVMYGRRLWADSDTTVTTSAVNFRDGSWHRVALVYDFSTPLFSVYVDGVLNNSSASGLSSGVAEVGSSQRIDVGFPTSSCIRAYMYNWQFWDIAFSPEHAIWDYSAPLAIATQAFNSPYGDQRSNLKIWYRFGEPSGIPLDYSGNGYTPTTSGTSVATLSDPAPPVLAWVDLSFPSLISELLAPTGADADIDITFPLLGNSLDAEVNQVTADINFSFPAFTFEGEVFPGAAADIDFSFPAPTYELMAPEGADADIDFTFPFLESFLTAGTNRTNMDWGAVILPQPDITRQLVMNSDTSNSRRLVLRATTVTTMSCALLGKVRLGRSRTALLRCGAASSIEAESVLSGRHTFDRNFALRSRAYTQLFSGLRCDDGSKPIVELDNLRLRDSSIYEAPASLFTLPWIYGDYSAAGLSVPLYQVDRVNNIWLVADHQLELIELMQDGIPMTGGWQYLPSYVDPTGRQVCAVKLSASAGNSALTARVRGRAYLSGTLINNPADVVEDVLENLQGYSPEFIDRASLGAFRASCSIRGITFRKHLNAVTTVKAFLSYIALNTNAVHTTDRGRHGMRRREGYL